jgi:diacylglycerol kinase family enzyme
MMIPAFVNPRAGTADAARRALLDASGFDVRAAPPETLERQVRDAVRAGAPRVLVAGGDGSIGSAAAALGGTATELAILPSGTLNHLAKDLGLPLDLAAAARIAIEGPAAAIDAAAVNDHVFLSTSAVGAYASFVRLRERLERRVGYRLASFVAGARLLARLPLSRVTLVVGGATREYVTPLVFVGVGERELRLPAFGARLPGGRPGLHVMVVRERSSARALALAFAAAARGVRAVADTPALDAFLVEACRIDSPTRSVALDGEVTRLSSPLDYRHLPGYLRVVGVAHAAG